MSKAASYFLIAVFGAAVAAAIAGLAVSLYLILQASHGV